MDGINPINYRLLFISSKQDDQNYQKFLNAIKDDKLSKKLQNNSISVGTNFIKEGGFNMMLYDGGFPVDSMNNFDEQKFNTMLDTMNQKGGNNNFEEKYKKYKKKYMREKKSRA